MKDLVIKIYDDDGSVIYQQTFFNRDENSIDEHCRKLVKFFMASDYATFDWNPR